MSRNGATRSLAKNNQANSKIPTNIWIVFALLLTHRIVNALCIKTFFQPDEYFQSLEPAWRLAFGPASGAWITWEWREQLRSSLHPILFAGVYKAADQLAHIMHMSAVSRAEMLVQTPKVLQAGIAALGDFFTWQLAQRVYGVGSSASIATLALTVFSPWQWFFSVRTLSNSLEGALTVAALYHWPWEWSLLGNQPDHRDQDLSRKRPETMPSRGLYISLTLAAIACILRPTNIIIWATISQCFFYRTHRTRNIQAAIYLAESAIVCGSAVLALSISMDRMFYGHWTFPPVKFLYFNVVQSLSVFYGTNRSDYYLTEGLPLLLTTALPFAATGLWQALTARDGPDLRQHREQRRSIFVLACVVVSTVVIMSLISHKEVRFIYPLLPILHVLAARPLAGFFYPAKKFRFAIMFLMLAVNVLIAMYVSNTHQRGVIDVMHYLRHEHEGRSLDQASLNGTTTTTTTTVGFLMPCHSTPWRSHLVYSEIEAWALTCEPPLDIPLAERQHYLDEADVFYSDPAAWIAENMGQEHGEDKDSKRRPWPDHLVFFQQLESVMLYKVRLGVEDGAPGYEECWRGFNTHWHDDGRRQGDVVVWCLRCQLNQQ